MKGGGIQDSLGDFADFGFCLHSVSLCSLEKRSRLHCTQLLIIEQK